MLWLGVLAALSTLACAQTGPTRPKYRYTEREFRAEIRQRVPELRGTLLDAPFAVGRDAVRRARSEIEALPPGPGRVQRLIDMLQEPQPTGFGLRYDWLASQSAERTLDTRSGNCLSFASVLVGIGRELDWPIYYALARVRNPETLEHADVSFLLDHVVVIVAVKSFQMVIDFTGILQQDFELEPIDDLTAYALMLNNVASRHIALAEGGASNEEWERARQGFELATRIQPKLGRAWNNLGIALSRLDRFDEARAAYERALSLDPRLRSASRNLTVLETRSAGAPAILESEVSDP